MIIEFHCTGGLANLNLACVIDTEQLSESMAEKFAEWIGEVQVADRESEMIGEVHGAADYFTYQLNVRTDGEENRFVFSDVNAPGNVRPLLDHLRNIAVEQKMRGNK